MKRFILGMIPSLIVLNIFAIASLFSSLGYAYTEIKADDGAVIYSPVKGAICLKLKNNPETTCQSLKNRGLIFQYKGQAYQLTDKYLLINARETTI